MRYLQLASPRLRGNIPTVNQIIIVGGFTTSPRHYLKMQAHLEHLNGPRSQIVPIQVGDWPGVIGQRGWTLLLTKLDQTLGALVPQNGKVLIVAHSLGGIVTRLYLAPSLPLKFKPQHADQIAAVITLGSPHQRGLVGRLNRWNGLDKCLIGRGVSVPVFSVAGSIDYSRRRRSLAAHAARLRYRIHGGTAGERGDGIIPVESAILDPARSLVLDGIKHDFRIGHPWYGDEEVVSLWWNAAMKSLSP